jgi:hypothetical protein
VDDDEQLAIEFKDDPLADAPYAADGLRLQRVDRRINGPENKRTVEGKALEASAHYVACQGFEIDDDVGKFRNVISGAS